MTDYKSSPPRGHRRRAEAVRIAPTAMPADVGAHRPSHLQLLEKVPSYGVGAFVARTPLSAVVVPTNRPFRSAGTGMSLAAKCADAKGAQLVVIRSQAAAAEPFPFWVLPPGSRPAVVIDLPPGAPDPCPRSLTRHHLVDTMYRHSDLSLKRNAGLALGVLLGWDTVLFMDDDLSITPASGLRSGTPGAGAGAGLWSAGEAAHPLLRLDDVLADFAVCPDLRAAGYLQRDFDDNSVVCHVRRRLGLPQGGFISGGALVVRIDAQVPFFPTTYNEDWAFLFDLMVRGPVLRPTRAVKWVGAVHQQRYYPYSVARARSEELGDLLAEGLMPLLDREQSPEVFQQVCSAAYWERVVRQRQGMVAQLAAQSFRRSLFLRRRGWADATEALREALLVYQGASPGSWGDCLAGYLCDRQHDLVEWWRTLAGWASGAPSGSGSFEEALVRLGWSTTWGRTVRSDGLESGWGVGLSVVS